MLCLPKGDDAVAKRNNGEGTLRKRADGRWEGRYTIEINGKPKVKYILAHSQKECKEKLEAAISKYEEEQQKMLRCSYLTNPNPTLAEWSQIWLDNFCKNCIKDYTYQGYKLYMEKHINPAIGHLELSKITTVVCQQFLMEMYTNGRKRGRATKGTGLALKTVKDIKITLQTCLQKAVDEELLPINPVKKVKLPKEQKKEMQTMKASDLKAFLDEAKNSGCYEFYYLELLTGMRIGEILALTWDDLDTENNSIRVNKQVQRIDGELVINTPKTEASIRTITICDDCVLALLKMRQREAKVSNLIFPSPITGSYRDPRAVTNRLHRIQDRAGVPRIRFHDLRHSFATLSLEQGMDIKTVSHMLGHTDAGFTMNTYMHVTDTMQKAVADTMGKLIQNSESQPSESKVIKLNA